LKQKTGAELVVATMPDIGGEDAAEYFFCLGNW